VPTAKASNIALSLVRLGNSRNRKGIGQKKNQSPNIPEVVPGKSIFSVSMDTTSNAGMSNPTPKERKKSFILAA